MHLLERMNFDVWPRCAPGVWEAADMWRAPVGRAGRGPQRVGMWTASDMDGWTHAVCGRVLPGYEGDAPEGRKPPAGPSQPSNPGRPPGPSGPDKNPPVPPKPPGG